MIQNQLTKTLSLTQWKLLRNYDILTYWNMSKSKNQPSIKPFQIISATKKATGASDVTYMWNPPQITFSSPISIREWHDLYATVKTMPMFFVRVAIDSSRSGKRSNTATGKKQSWGLDGFLTWNESTGRSKEADSRKKKKKQWWSYGSYKHCNRICQSTSWQQRESVNVYRPHNQVRLRALPYGKPKV